MAGNQTEVVDEDGTDCGTETTLDFIFDANDINDFARRYINDNGKTVLLTKDNASTYNGRLIHMYSPMCCKGTKSGKICSKCAGILDSKFVGLDSNKIATTLTNLNMKKFHDSTLRFQKLDMNDMLLSRQNIFKADGTDIAIDVPYFELYVPDSYFKNSLMAETAPGQLRLFGITTVGIYKNGEFDHFDTLKVPSWNTYYTYEYEHKVINLPGIGKTGCTVYSYSKGHKFCVGEVLEDSTNAQLMLRFVNYGKIPSTVPYKESIWLWRKNQKMNKVNFGVPSVIQEVVLSTAYRWKRNPAYKFAKVIGKNPDWNQFDYEMASIRRICQVTSTFTGMTFESFDDMVSTAINRSRKGTHEAESPLEELLKL
jgi:hypothetical protein